ncbi:chromate transporter [Scopulibacillus cellulosilyticus]|uniref:Chromate transporter n=1 Tax=Scopulibacillus cellulosilyticus TaxID=2665665 RepID=A0ABW2PXG0_9BACL
MGEVVNLSLASFRVGMLGFGGGPSSIPLVQKEVVEKYKWMDDDEFGDILALANTLPGPILTKMCGYVGWRVAKWPGMIAAIIASVIPTAFLMIVLLAFLSTFQNKPWVQGMTKAVIPIVGVMLLTLTLQFFQKAKDGLGWLASIILAAVSLVLMQFIHIHPAIIIVALILYVLIKPSRKSSEEKEKGRGTG